MARDSPETLDDEYTSARRSEAFFSRLRQLGEKGGLKTMDPNERLKVCYECGTKFT